MGEGYEILSSVDFLINVKNQKTCLNQQLETIFDKFHLCVSLKLMTLSPCAFDNFLISRTLHNLYTIDYESCITGN